MHYSVFFLLIFVFQLTEENAEWESGCKKKCVVDLGMVRVLVPEGEQVFSRITGPLLGVTWFSGVRDKGLYVTCHQRDLGLEKLETLAVSM